MDDDKEQCESIGEKNGSTVRCNKPNEGGSMSDDISDRAQMDLAELLRRFTHGKVCVEDLPRNLRSIADMVENDMEDED